MFKKFKGLLIILLLLLVPLNCVNAGTLDDIPRELTGRQLHPLDEPLIEHYRVKYKDKNLLVLTALFTVIHDQMEYYDVNANPELGEAEYTPTTKYLLLKNYVTNNITPVYKGYSAQYMYKNSSFVKNFIDKMDNKFNSIGNMSPDEIRNCVDVKSGQREAMYLLNTMGDDEKRNALVYSSDAFDEELPEEDNEELQKEIDTFYDKIVQYHNYWIAEVTPEPPIVFDGNTSILDLPAYNKIVNRYDKVVDREIKLKGKCIGLLSVGSLVAGLAIAAGVKVAVNKNILNAPSKLSQEAKKISDQYDQMTTNQQQVNAYMEVRRLEVEIGVAQNRIEHNWGDGTGGSQARTTGEYNTFIFQVLFVILAVIAIILLACGFVALDANSYLVSIRDQLYDIIISVNPKFLPDK
jgi:hypothetical protein